MIIHLRLAILFAAERNINSLDSKVVKPMVTYKCLILNCYIERQKCYIERQEEKNYQFPLDMFRTLNIWLLLYCKSKKGIK